MNHCKNCQYFEKVYPISGYCKSEKIFHSSVFSANEIIKSDELIIESDFGEGCSIEVGIDFGCIHFEAKE